MRAWLENKIQKYVSGIRYDVLIPPDEKLGDYSTNAAFVLAKKDGKDPLETARNLAAAMMNNPEIQERFEKIEPAGSGFINFFLRADFLRNIFGKTAIYPDGYGCKVIVEYPSTNVAKPMHIGHSRPAFIGDALARVYGALGYNVVRWDHLGDWGTQFGMIIAAYKEWGDKNAIRAEPLQALNDLYVRYVNKIKEDDAYAERARQEFLKLERGDAENTNLWRWFVELSLKESHRMYALLGLLPSQREAGESFYLKDIPKLIEYLKENGIAQYSEGALVINLEQFNLPTALIQKSDGASVYLTRDIASLLHRIRQECPKKILYVVGNEQTLHLQQLFAIADLMKLTDGGRIKLIHVKYGLILGESGAKLSTREGTAVLLEDVVDKAVKLAENVVREKNPHLAQEQIGQIARMVGVGALKYNDLKQHPHSDIVFDWKRILDLTGNSGPYLQYTYARLANISRKAGIWARIFARPDITKLTHEKELRLMKQIINFPDAVRSVARDNALSGLALYLYELAACASRYYEEVRILADDDRKRRDARLKLMAKTASILRLGLELLGIQAPERI